MNNQLIEKIITSNNIPCPEFTFNHPLLDKNVAKALSKGFVNILKLSKQTSKGNDNLRLPILENIRKMCQVEPENHIKIDDNIATLLSDVYEEKIKKANMENSDLTEKVLDEFLVRNMKDMNIDTSYKPSINPESLQALININENSLYLNILYKDIVHWNIKDNKSIHILKDAWMNDIHITEDISFKLKSEVEKILLEVCLEILTQTDLNIEEIFESNILLKKIVKRSSDSTNCFQMSCSIINYLFVMSNFSPSIQMLAQTFVSNVKQCSSHITFSVLYPTNLSHIVVLLDIDTDNIPMSVQTAYIKEVVKYLSKLQSESEDDLIMLLSHFPQWFDIYFNKKALI